MYISLVLCTKELNIFYYFSALKREERSLKRKEAKVKVRKQCTTILSLQKEH